MPDKPTETEAALALDRLAPGVHRDLYALWLDKYETGRLPSRASFDPTEMPHLLPHITIFDVKHDPLRFRIRLVGTAIVDAMGEDTTGRYLDELPNTERIQDASLATRYQETALLPRWAAADLDPFQLQDLFGARLTACI